MRVRRREKALDPYPVINNPGKTAEFFSMHFFAYIFT
jgi:hypothetical protein